MFKNEIVGAFRFLILKKLKLKYEWNIYRNVYINRSKKRNLEERISYKIFSPDIGSTKSRDAELIIGLENKCNC